MITEHSVVVAIEKHVSGELPDGDMVILSLTNGVYYGLNNVGARIWSLIKKPTMVMDICDILLAEYDVDRAQCLSDVLSLLNELDTNHLISLSSENIRATI